MVKGTTRQVIVVHSPDRKLFEQAIFIVKENAADVTDEMLLKEAQRAIRHRDAEPGVHRFAALWAFCGAAATALVWLLTALI